MGRVRKKKKNVEKGQKREVVKVFLSASPPKEKKYPRDSGGIARGKRRS